MLQLTKYLKLIIGERKEKLAINPQRFSSNMPPVVVWNINNSCNMTCPHCYSSAKVNPLFDGVTTEQAYYIIDCLKDYGISVVIFSGGEPLLRDDFFLLANYAKQKKIQCHLSTNGTLITKEIAKNLKLSGIKYVGVSIDGLESFNDNYRGLKDAYSLAMSGLMNARDMGLMTGIRLTLTSINKDYLFPLLNTAIDNGISRFYISHLLYGGRGMSQIKHDLSIEENRILITDFFKKATDLISEDKDISLVCGGNDADNVFLHLYIKDRFGVDNI
jgi:MoaA/NifB/PqqE/SkfB family radical SAM enzyme